MLNLPQETKIIQADSNKKVESNRVQLSFTLAATYMDAERQVEGINDLA